MDCRYVLATVAMGVVVADSRKRLSRSRIRRVKGLKDIFSQKDIQHQGLST